MYKILLKILIILTLLTITTSILPSISYCDDDWVGQADGFLNKADDSIGINKGKIKAKAPSEYMAEFSDVNPNIDSAMKTHLIEDLHEYGVFDDDYNIFFEHRLKAIHSEMINQIDERANDILKYD